MEIADPARRNCASNWRWATRLRWNRADIALFLDSDPLQRHLARLERSAYEAQPTPAANWRIDWMQFYRGTAAHRPARYGEVRRPRAAGLVPAASPACRLRQSVGL
jgi:hypothetical protein